MISRTYTITDKSSCVYYVKLAGSYRAINLQIEGQKDKKIVRANHSILTIAQLLLNFGEGPFENPQPVQPVQPGPTTVVVQTSQPQVVQPPPVIHFTENPQTHHCAFCNDNIVTNTKIEMGTGSWIAVGVLLFLTGIVIALILTRLLPINR